MSLVRIRVALACLTVMLLTSTPAAAQSVEERLISKLAAVSVESDQRTAAFNERDRAASWLPQTQRIIDP